MSFQIPVKAKRFHNPVKKRKEIARSPEGMPIFGYDDAGRPICSAKTERGPCKIWKDLNPSNGRCYYHGGASLEGVNHPSFKHGAARHSRYSGAFLTQEDWEAFQARCRDPDLLSLREDIAFADSELAKIVEEWGLLGKPTLRAIQANLGKLSEELEKTDAYVPRVLDVLNVLVSQIDGAIIERERAQVIERKQTHRRKLVATETQRLAAGMRAISADRFLALILDMRAWVRENITQPEDRKRFIRYLERLIGEPPRTEEPKDANVYANEDETE